MAGVGMLRGMVAAMAMGLHAALAMPAASTEYTQFLPVWLGPDPATAAPALLNLPPGWASGDAAVAIPGGGDWTPGMRDRLVAALLEAGAAVLELNQPRDTAPLLAEAVGMLRGTVGAGLVVVLGAGEGGQAALDLVAAVPELAAAIRLDPDLPAFRVGAVPDDQAWPLRAPLLCAALGVAWVGASGPFVATCRAGLVATR